MPSFLNQQISPPETWQEFEKLCHDLWRKIWDDPNAQRNGRVGQPQHGIDIFGQPKGGGDYHGVQCKGKDGRYGHAVTERELRDEVRKAKRFNPRIKSFILATTAQNDSSIQEVARQLTQENRAQGQFSVAVFGWDEIQSRLADYPKLLDKHYPDQGPAQHKLGQQLERVLEKQLSMEADQAKLPTNIAESVVQHLRNAGVVLSLHDGITDPKDEALNQEIDSYRDRIEVMPKTALSLLRDLRLRCWEGATKKTRFRILTNIGSAYVTLGELDKAAELFLEAKDHAEAGDVKAMRNAAFAHLIREEYEEATIEVRRAIAVNPDDSDGYALLVAASTTISGADKLERLVPEAHLSKSNVVYTIGHSYRRQGRTEEALHWLRRAYDLDPMSNSYRASYGSELIGQVVDKNKGVLSASLTDADLNCLDTAASVLQGMWEDVRGKEIGESFAWAGVNLCTALSILGRRIEARRIISEIAATGFEAPELRKLGALLALENGDTEAALSHLSNVAKGADREIDLLRAEILAQSSRFNEALNAVDEIDFSDGKEEHRLAAKGFRLRLLARVEGSEKALAAAHEVAREYADEPMIHVSLAKLHHDLENQETAKEEALKAEALLTSNSTLTVRAAVADVLYDLELFREAGHIYKSLVHSYRDCPTLRRFLVCLYQTKQLKSVHQALSKLSEGDRQRKFYRRIAAAVYMLSGELDKASREAEAYLQDEPNDLEMRLNWIGLIQRIGNDDVIRDFLSSVPQFPTANPAHQMQLAHLLSEYGFSKESLELAYELRRKHQNNPQVHLGYMSLMLFRSVPHEVTKMSRVGPDAAFVLEDSKGRRQTYIVEDHWTDGLYSGEIPSTHPLAQLTVGRAVGDEITVPVNPMQVEKKKIAQVVSKYAHLFHVTASEFSTRFPDNRSFWNVDVGAKDGDGFDFAPIFKALDQRQSHVQQVEEHYRTGRYPVCFIAPLIGVHPLEAWSGIMEMDRLDIKCCAGTAPERAAGFRLVAENDKGYVIDPLTLYSIVTLGIEDELTGAFGRFRVVQSAIDMYKNLILEKRLHPSSGSMAKVGEKYAIQEFTPEQIEDDISRYEKVLDWMVANCDVVPAIGDAPQDWIEITDHVDKAMTDTIFAAAESGGLLLSDDQNFRAIAKEMSGVDGIWSQVLMIGALERQKLAFEKYCTAVRRLVDWGFYFTTVSKEVLFHIAKMERWELTDSLQKVLATLGGENVELRSSMRVGLGFLWQLWQDDVPNAGKLELTKALITALTKSHSTMAVAILRAFVELAEKISARDRQEYLDTVGKWCTENSVQMPTRRRMSYFAGRYSSFRRFLLGTTAHTSEYVLA